MVGSLSKHNYSLLKETVPNVLSNVNITTSWITISTPWLPYIIQVWALVRQLYYCSLISRMGVLSPWHSEWACWARGHYMNVLSLQFPSHGCADPRHCMGALVPYYLSSLSCWARGRCMGVLRQQFSLHGCVGLTTKRISVFKCHITTVGM